MSDIWQWFHEREMEYAESGDRQRLQMARLRSQAFDVRETDPAAMLKLYQKGRDLAHRMNEPWWTYLYDVWIAIAQKSYVYDLKKALTQSLFCVHEARQPILKQHPWTLAAHNILLGCYVQIDPVGYSAPIRQCLRQLDKEISPQPGEHRYVMYVEKCEFLMHVGRIAEAERVALEHLALYDRDPDPDEWYEVAPLENLCWIKHRQRDWRQARDYAQLVEENSTARQRMPFSVASAKLWLAIAAWKDGDTKAARRHHRAAVNLIRHSQREPCREHYDALAYFHEVSEDLDKALEVRDQQLAKLVGKGRHGYECEVRIHRCELLARLGRLARDDIGGARQATTLLKKPKPYQTRIQRLEKSLPKSGGQT